MTVTRKNFVLVKKLHKIEITEIRGKQNRGMTELTLTMLTF